MSGSSRARVKHRWAARRPGAMRLSVALVALAFAGSLTAIALAGGGTVRIGSAANATLAQRVVVNAGGRTLYELSPETSGHLLCKSSECLEFWPPVTIPSRNSKLLEGGGVHGHLGVLRRHNGTLQLTLGGRPLYRFSGDTGKDEANGQGIKSFGGTWHAVSASSGSPAATPAGPTPPPAPAPPSPPSSPNPPYGY